jgi:hypothetical protein
MRGRHLLWFFTLGCAVACSGDRPKAAAPQQVATSQAPVVTLAATPAATAGDSVKPRVLPDSLKGIPQFAAGMYDLVAVRDEPLLDDSAAVRNSIERMPLWASLDSARGWRDSVRAINRIVDEAGDNAHDLSETDSVAAREASRRVIELVSCTAWQAGARLRLEPDGGFAVERRYRKYCRGKVPAYTHWTDSLTSVLSPCEDPWEAPAAGMVRHLTCRYGRYWDGVYNYRHVGDTLRLSSDCDGSDTYVLRNPQRPIHTVARSGAVLRRTDEC